MSSNSRAGAGVRREPQPQHAVDVVHGGGQAPAKHEVGELGREGPAPVVDLVAAIVGGLGGVVPDVGVDGHGLGRVVGAHGAEARHLVDRHAVGVEDDGAGGPEDGEAATRAGGGCPGTP